MRLLRSLFLASAVLGGLFRRRRHHPDPRPRSDTTLEREVGGPRWAPCAISLALLGAAAAFVAFIALLLTSPTDAQLLAVTLGGGLALTAFALIAASRILLPREVADEPHPPVWDRQARADAAEDLVDGFEGVSRRKMLLGAAGAAGAALTGAAVALPLAGAGPGVGEMDAQPWRDGIALVDEDGQPVTADSIPIGEFRTAFPRGADPRELGSPVVVVRVDPRELALPQSRAGWAPHGLLAFSRICTHAGCAISLYRSPSFASHEAGPALICPCHYSTFDVRRAGQVIFGPAGRPLPQLPLRIAGDGTLVAAGSLSGSVGPAWWGTARS